MIISITEKDNLQQTIDNAAAGATIILADGVYREKVVVNKQLTIMGGGRDNVVIVYDDCANKIDANGLLYTTFRSYTVAVTAVGVRLENLTIKNDTADPKVSGQCVALSVYADDFIMTNCRVVSTQDTLFCGPLPDDLIARYAGFLPDSLCSVEGEMRQRYINCEIFGSVDYIFGCGAATFEQCTMVSVNDGRDIGYVAAPSHSLKQTEGFLFKNCHFRAADGVKDGSVYLARAWRDFGKATFENCQFDKCIHEDRFANWQGTDRYRFNRFLVTLS